MFRISIIIPAYNSADTIREAIESVRTQDLFGKAEGGNLRPAEGEEKDWDVEIIVVDDASTDETTAVVESLLARFQVSGLRSQILRLQSNSGPAAARNRGIAEAQGEWIAFLDADDAWVPGKLAMQMEYVKQNPDVVMVCGETLSWNGKVKDEGRNLKPEIGMGGGKKAEDGAASSSSSSFRSYVSSFRRIHLDEFVVGNPVATSTVLVKKDVLSAVGGFDEQFRGPEDYDLWMRIAAGHPVAFCSAPLACYRHTPGSLSMDDRKFLPMVLKVLDKAFGQGGVFADRRHLRPAAVSNQYWNASWMAFCRGARLTAIRCWFVSYFHNMEVVRSTRRKWFSLLFRYFFGRVPAG